MDQKICGSHSAFCKWLPNEIPLRAVILKVWPEDSGFLNWKKAPGILKTYDLPIGITFRLIHLVTPSLYGQQQLGIVVEPKALALTNSETPTRCSTFGQAASDACNNQLHPTSAVHPSHLIGMWGQRVSARYPAVPVTGKNTPHAGNGVI